MTITIEELDAELVRAMNEGRAKEWEAAMQETSLPQATLMNARLDRAGRIAMARFVAERQRAVEPTEEMEAAAVPLLDSERLS